MHAISRDPTSYAKPCIYLQLDEGEDEGEGPRGVGEGAALAEADGEADETEEQDAAEVRLVPAEASTGVLYSTLRRSSAASVQGAHRDADTARPLQHSPRSSLAARPLSSCTSSSLAQCYTLTVWRAPCVHVCVSVDDMFKVLCDCAALNPDSEVDGEPAMPLAGHPRPHETHHQLAGYRTARCLPPSKPTAAASSVAAAPRLDTAGMHSASIPSPIRPCRPSSPPQARATSSSTRRR
jgi:hypothetical protein